MSLYSNQLRTSIEDCSEISRQVIEDKAGVSQPQLTRYLRGEHRPPRDVFEAIAKLFPVEHQLKLLLAYLEDEIPPGMRDLVLLQPADTSARTKESAPTYRTRMNKELRAAHDFLGADALEHADTADILIGQYRRLKPQD